MTGKQHQEKPFGWGAIAIAVGAGYVLSNIRDNNGARDVAAYAEAPSEYAAASSTDASIQPLFEAPEANDEPAGAPGIEYAEPTYFANCSAARAAGAAPVRAGDPGYASHLDRDNDGIGCE